jgi:hypothetical protein
MEVLFTIAILIALVALGVTISQGNERQRAAIQSVHEQLQDWTEQDIRLKREKLAREVVIGDPRHWLEENAGRALGSFPQIQTVEAWANEGACALVAICQDGRRLVFTPVERKRFLAAVDQGNSRLSRANPGPLGSRPDKTPYKELSLVTASMFFDLEAKQAWQQLTGQPLAGERLWMYIVERL